MAGVAKLLSEPGRKGDVKDPTFQEFVRSLLIGASVFDVDTSR